MAEIQDIAIVGGGPAGAYCAYLLAKRGLKPVIFDYSHPREKPCGGGISPLAIEKFPFIDSIPSKGSMSANVKIIAPNGKEAIARGIRKGFNISRRFLDEAILNMAVKEGAVLAKERVIDVKKGAAFWEIQTKTGLVKAKKLVGADGVNSLVRKKTIGPIPSENIGMCYGYMVSGTENLYSTIKFLKELPSGYIWIFPRENHTSIGIGSTLKCSKHLKTILDEFISSSLPNIKKQSAFAAMIPFVKEPDFFRLPCSGKDWLLIGDAAGHVDPNTGEGILYALWDAEIAYKAIIDDDLEYYDNEWKKEYGNDLIEGCKQKGSFYNQFMLKLSVALTSRSNTYSKLMYDIITSEQEYKTFNRRLFTESPRVLFEIIRHAFERS